MDLENLDIFTPNSPTLLNSRTQTTMCLNRPFDSISHSNAPNIQDTKTTWYTAEINVDSEFHVLFTIHNWCKQIPSACNEFITPIRTNQSMATMGRNGGWRMN